MQHSLLGWGDGILALVRLSGADRAYRCPHDGFDCGNGGMFVQDDRVRTGVD